MCGNLIPTRSGDDGVRAVRQCDGVGGTGSKLCTDNFQKFASIRKCDRAVVAKHDAARFRCCTVHRNRIRHGPARDHVVTGANGNSICATNITVLAGYDCGSGRSSTAVGQYLPTSLIAQHEIPTSSQCNRIVSRSGDDTVDSVTERNRVVATNARIDGFDQSQVSVGEE